MKIDQTMPSAPVGLAVLAFVGPAFVWCAEYIGSGEVILSTRMGAILGYGILWAPFFGIILKSVIGLAGARYTVCTGEGMIDMFSRMPGRGNWAVWIVLISQLCAGSISIGSVASAAGMFANSLIPLKPFIWGWLLTILAIVVVWSGKFNVLKYVMSLFVFIIIAGVFYVSLHTFPGFSVLLKGIFGFQVPEVPGWALKAGGVSSNSWHEILPLIGWAAGGFASQVWYTYWVLGAGYGMANGRKYGEPCDVETLKTMSAETARKVQGWCRVVFADASVATCIGISVTCGFLIAGAGILGPLKLAPEGERLAFELSAIFGKLWGEAGGVIFIITGLAALTSTLIGQFAGWPRLIADSLRICVPGFNKRIQWKTQFNICIALFFFTSIVIIYSLGFKPVFIIKISAVFEGLLFTPLQAVLVLIAYIWVLPKLLPREAWKILRPHWLLYVGLVLSALVFGYFCIFQLFPIGQL